MTTMYVHIIFMDFSHYFLTPNNQCNQRLLKSYAQRRPQSFFSFLSLSFFLLFAGERLVWKKCVGVAASGVVLLFFFSFLATFVFLATLLDVFEIFFCSGAFYINFQQSKLFFSYHIIIIFMQNLVKFY